MAPQLKPEIILTDFERALQEALRENFPSSHMLGCFFHSSNAMWRKARSLGLSQAMTDNPAIKQVVKMTMALTLLPGNHVAEGITAIQTYLTEQNIGIVLDDYMKYIRSIWIEDVGGRNLSVYSQPRRTNNDQESFHNQLLLRFGQTHQNIWTFLGGAVGDNVDVILSVLETCLQPQSEPEAALQTLMSVSFILTHAQDTLAGVGDIQSIIQRLCTKVLQPQLVWRAGRSAEALRTAATGCVVAALELQPCPPQLAQQLVPLLLGLVEDSAYRTRQLAILSLLNIVEALRKGEALGAQDMNTIFPVVMKRLDDNDDKVRETAVRTLCALFHPPLPSDYQLDCYRPHLESLYDTMLLHLDDPNPTFQGIMLGAIKEVASSHPSLMKSRIQLDNFRSKAKCEELIKFLDQLQI